MVEHAAIIKAKGSTKSSFRVIIGNPRRKREITFRRSDIGRIEHAPPPSARTMNQLARAGS
jgi:hypothetical protein